MHIEDNSLNSEVHMNDIFDSYPTENMLSFHYKNQLIINL
jgi:hypothetical protein